MKVIQIQEKYVTTDFFSVYSDVFLKMMIKINDEEYTLCNKQNFETALDIFLQKI